MSNLLESAQAFPYSASVMGLLSFLHNSRHLPFSYSTVVVAGAADALAAEDFLGQLRKKFGDLGLAITTGDYCGELPWVPLPGTLAQAKKWLANSAAQRLVFLGTGATYGEAQLEKRAYWVNAGDATTAVPFANHIFVNNPALLSSMAGAVFTGDPLLNITHLPDVVIPECARFQEQHHEGRWVGYFAATREGEEEMAYQIFSRLIRERMGLMLLAPYDVARAEPVYRDALKYRLQTIRHNRLSTSFVPLKTRVYYIEEENARRDLYGCADFVVAGGSLKAGGDEPDIVTPLLSTRPLIVGPAGRQSRLIQAAIRANVVWAAESAEQIVQHALTILQQPKEAKEKAQMGRAWLMGQAGASARIVELIQ